MRRVLKYLMAVVCLALPVAVQAGIPARPSPPQLVNDFAGLFDSSERAKLERMLTAFDDTTSNQITVVTVNDLEGYDPAEYATQIGLKWGVGSAQFNNGIVVLVKPKNDSEGRVSIQVGYGLEGAIPDVYAKHIIENQMIPEFQTGDYFAGVYAGCEELMALACGEISQPRDYDDGTLEMWVTSIVILAILLFFVLTVRKKGNGDNFGGGGTRRHIFVDPIGGWGGSSGSGGGFGGFGGGSFGGGGASGKW